MKPYTHPKDEGLKFQRKIGKRRRKQDVKLAAVAKAAPHELDELPEDPIRRLIEGEIRAAGLPYLTFEDADLYWLKRLAPYDFHAARILAAIKDLPDFITWKPAKGKPYALSLPLELKRAGKGGRPGQRAFAEAAGGFITQGYSPAHAALKAFLEATCP